MTFHLAVSASLVIFITLVPLFNFSPSSERKFNTPWYKQYHNQYPEMASDLYQGDILLPKESLGKNAIKIDHFKWPKGEIPYVFHEKFQQDEREKVLAAMSRLESQTCIKFVPLKTRIYNSYIEVGNTTKGCYAMIGYRRQRSGQGLPVNLQVPECTKHQGTIEHELLHVIGLLHEQARHDRDDYVNIIWENVDKKYYTDFNKASEKDTSPYGIPYDYKSVMHYPKHAFSMNGKETMVAKQDPKTELGQRVGATNGDLEKVRQMYCNKNTINTATTAVDVNEVDEVEDNRYLDNLLSYF